MKLELKKGSTIFDVLDGIETAVVTYMAGKRGLTELAFRNLLNTSTEVRASYGRKIARTLASTGLNPTKLVG